MKAASGILLIVLGLFLISANAGLTNDIRISIKCFHSLDFRFFDLKPLMKEGDDFYTADRLGSTGIRLRTNFDFCETLPSAQKCGDQEALATDYDLDKQYAESCINLTQKPPAGQKVALIEKNDSVDEHILLEYTTDKTCAGDQTYGIVYQIFCDSKTDVVNPILVGSKSNDCRPHFEIHHKSGCKIGDINAVWRFVETNFWIFGTAFIVIGLFILILGRKLVRPTLAIIFCLSTIALIFFLFYVLILSNNVAKWVGWLLLAISIILGCIVGFFASKLIRIGVFFLGVWAGAGIGLLLNNTVFYLINHVAVLWVLMAVFGLALGVLSFFWYNYILIICTSILGAYLTVRGISLFTGGYPNEFTLFERIRDHDISGVPGTFYAFLAGIIVLIVIGIFIQLRIKRGEKDKDNSINKSADYYKRV